MDKDAAAFRRAVIFKDDRTEPLDCLPLHMHGAGGRPVEDPPQRRDIVFGPDLGRKKENAVKHGRYDMRMRDALFIDQPKHFLCVPLVHQYRADAGRERKQEIEGQRRRVIERPCHHSQVRGVVEPRRLDHLAEKRRGRWRAAPVNALRMTGRARRIEHLAADDRIVDILAGLARDQRVVRGKTLDWSAHGELYAQTGRRGSGLRRRGSKPYIRDKSLGLAIVHDISDFRRREMPVDGSHPESGPLTGHDGFDEFGTVDAEQRHTIAGLKARASQHPDQPVGLCIQLRKTAVAFFG